MNYKVLINFAFAIFMILLVACNKSSEVQVPQQIVYMCGNNQGKACLWKDKTFSYLDNANSVSYAESMSIFGSDVFIAGQGRVGNSYGPVYWKNSDLVPLVTDTSGINSSATGIFISGSDIHVCGTLEKGKKNVATYWKNNTQVSLSGNAAKGIAVINNDVYIVGQYNYSSAVYWKNGVRNLLDGYAAECISVSGNDVYIAGFSVIGSKFVATYWKNGVKQSLTVDQKVSSYAFGIAVANNNVFVVGDVDGVATYWKNGVPTSLLPQKVAGSIAGTNIPLISTASAIFINGDDFYISGNKIQGGGTRYIGQVVYWKNGVMTETTNSGYGHATSIFVK